MLDPDPDQNKYGSETLPEGAADEGGQQRLSVRLLPRPQPHKLLSQVPGHHLYADKVSYVVVKTCSATTSAGRGYLEEGLDWQMAMPIVPCFDNSC
jgi:hypothetical protein